MSLNLAKSDGGAERRTAAPDGLLELVLKHSPSASLHQAEEPCRVRLVQRQLDQRVVDIALVAKKLRPQGGELQGGAGLFDDRNRLLQGGPSEVAVARAPCGPPQAKESFPLLFRCPALLRDRQSRLEILPGSFRLIQPEERFTSIKVGVRFLQPVMTLLGELQGAVERFQCCR